MGDNVTSMLGAGLGLATGGVGSALIGGLLPSVTGSMGKQSSPDAPNLTKAALDSSNISRYNESGPFGSVAWSLRPGAAPNNPQIGDYVRTTSLSPEQQKLYDLGVGNQLQTGQAVGSQLSDLSGGAKSVADAIYNKQTQYLDQNFGDQTRALETQLQNQGLMPGSEAYDRELRNLRQTQQGAYTTAANNATIGSDAAQSNAVSRIASLLAASKGNVPTSSNVGTTPDLASALMQKYQADLGGVNAQNAQTSNTLGTLGRLGTAALFAFSDRRLKSDIKHIGTAGNGLPMYEYTIGGKRERGYMADEVAAVYPDAVRAHSSGYLMVNYADIGGRP